MAAKQTGREDTVVAIDLDGKKTVQGRSDQDTVSFHICFRTCFCFRTSFKVKEYKRRAPKDFILIEKTEHSLQKTFIYDLHGNVTKFLDIVYYIYVENKNLH